MKKLLPAAILFSMILSGCHSGDSSSGNEQTNTVNDSTAPDFAGGFTTAGRLFPDKLRGLPQEMIVSHYPNPCFAVQEDSMYIWKHNTSVGVNEDMQLIEYGAFVYTKKGWYLRVKMSAADFAETYHCKDGLLKAGVTYTDSASWRHDKMLTGGDALWYFIANDKNGRTVKGMAVIETEGKLISNNSKQLVVSSTLLKWTGYAEVGSYSLSGSIPATNTNIEADSSGKISAVNMQLNVAGIQSDNKDLEEHLKSADFFDSAKYPSATFTTTAIKYTDVRHLAISGNLTIKEITKPISFTAVAEKVNAGQKLSGKISVNRTLFGITYNSKNFFGGLGDKAIKNDFDLLFEVVVKEE